MVGIVEADADELAHARHARADAGLAWHGWQGAGVDRAQAGQRGIAQLRAFDIAEHAREVAQGVAAVEQAGLFLAHRAITQ